MKAFDHKQRQARRLHRWFVPIAAAPLLITAASGSLYSLLLERGIAMDSLRNLSVAFFICGISSVAQANAIDFGSKAK